MTGRKGRVVSHDDGTVSYESRSKQDVSLEYLNIEEKKRFMCGEKVLFFWFVIYIVKIKEAFTDRNITGPNVSSSNQ